MAAFNPAHGWGPQHKPGALSLTFDNFGEAAEIESGSWGDRPVGEHYTAAFVPELIAMLGEARATYFVEGSNAALYPDALRRWRDAGHEIGVHGWRHERWDALAPDRRRELLTRSIEALRSIGVDPIGFRPPGGGIGAECLYDVRDAGLLYCSDLGEPILSSEDGLIRMPFRWRDVDSFVLEDLMAPVRVAQGEAAAAPGAQVWRDGLRRAVCEAAESGAHRVIVFHPMFLAKSEDKLAALAELIALAREADLWLAPLGEVARFAAREMNAPVAQAA